MTTAALTTDNSAVLAEFAGGQQTTDVAMMIGIGLVKDSEAVFFQYIGDDQQPTALMMPSGKPITRFSNITLAGIDIAEDVGEFKSTKLNVYIESNQGRVVMLTSGLTTIWSQCIMTALMGLWNSYDLASAFTLESWKGTSKLRPCFAAVKVDDRKVSDQMIYDQLAEARSDKDLEKLKITMRDCVQALKAALQPELASVNVIPTNTDKGEF